MAFQLTSRVDSGTAFLELSGELDAAAAPELRSEIESLAADGSLERLVLQLGELSYMASAGLRALVFAKQKLGQQVELYLVAAQAPVIETIELTGFHRSVTMQERFDPGEQAIG